MRRIEAEADSTTLARHATMAAINDMNIAVDTIDGRFAKGYAKQHPELIAAFMQTVAIGFGARVIAGAIEDIADPVVALATAVDKLAFAAEVLAGRE
jgi:hypothetical protein